MQKSEMKTYAKFCKFLDSLKARDKLTKIVQYGSRSAKHVLLAEDPKSDWGNRFDGLMATTATGRKLFRMLKFFNEIEAMNKILNSPVKDPISYYLNIWYRASYAVYWFFDNVNYLVRAKFLKYDKTTVGVYAGYGWFAGASFKFLASLYEFSKLNTKITAQSKLYHAEKNAKKEPAALQKSKDALVALYASRGKLVEDMTAQFCDVIISAHAAEVPQRLGFGKLNDLMMGLLGVISATIGAAQIWREL